MKDLTKGNTYKTFLLFAIPMVLSGVLSQAYHTVDAIIAGQALGEQGLAAIGATSALLTFLSSIFWGYGSGFCVYMARLFGAKDYGTIKKLVVTNTLLMLAALVGVSVTLFLLRDPVYDLLQVAPQIRQDTDTYFSICILGFACTALPPYGVHLMNAFGSSSFPLAMSVVSSVVNIAGNLLLVKPLGIAGLAIATVASSLAADIGFLIKAALSFRQMGVAKQKVRFSPRSLSVTLRYSLPTMCQQSVMYVSSMLLSPLVNGIGAAATASFAVAKQVYDFTSNIYQNSAKTLSAYAGQCIGAGKRHQLQKGLRVAFLQGLCFFLPVLALFVFFPDLVCGLFMRGRVDGDAYAYSVTFLQRFLPVILCNLIANLFHAFYRGCGMMAPLFAATCIGSAVQLTAGALLAPRYGIYGIFAGWALSWVADGLFGVLTYFFRYRSRVLRDE